MGESIENLSACSCPDVCAYVHARNDKCSELYHPLENIALSRNSDLIETAIGSGSRRSINKARREQAISDTTGGLVTSAWTIRTATCLSISNGEENGRICARSDIAIN